MTTICVNIRWEKNGKQEIFRTTKPNNDVPQGATLVKKRAALPLARRDHTIIQQAPKA